MRSRAFQNGSLIRFGRELVDTGQNDTGRNAAIGLERRFQPFLIIGCQEFRDLLRELFDIRPVRVIEAETLDKDRDNDDGAEKQRIHHKTAGMKQVKYIHFSKDPLI